jgi:hypothetical protein
MCAVEETPMATRATIAVQNQDGTFTSIYSHWDGYPSYVGRILYHHYKTLDKVQKLIDGGDVSSFDGDGTPNHYEELNAPVTSASYFDLMIDVMNGSTEYLYVFSEGNWEYVPLQELNNLRRPLSIAIGDPVEI